MAGRDAYEADVRRYPTYHDGTPRKTWAQLSDVERWSWTRPAKDLSAVPEHLRPYYTDTIPTQG